MACGHLTITLQVMRSDVQPKICLKGVQWPFKIIKIMCNYLAVWKNITYWSDGSPKGFYKTMLLKSITALQMQAQILLKALPTYVNDFYHYSVCVKLSSYFSNQCFFFLLQIFKQEQQSSKQRQTAEEQQIQETVREQEEEGARRMDMEEPEREREKEIEKEKEKVQKQRINYKYDLNKVKGMRQSDGELMRRFHKGLQSKSDMTLNSV